MGLLQKSNLKGRTPEAIWSESSETRLVELFKIYFKKVPNIIATIQDRGVEYSRRAITTKLIQLGLIRQAEEVKNLKKSDLEGMPEGEEPQGPKTGTRKQEIDYVNVPIEDVNDILSRMKSTPTVRAALQWLLEEVQDELKDRQDSPGKFAHH